MTGAPSAAAPPALRWTNTRADLDQMLRRLLDDGTGRVRPELRGLWLDLIAMPEPLRGLTWIRNSPHVAGYLRGLASGQVPLTHAGLSALDSWRTAAHLRDLLMAAGALPAADRQALLFDRWAQRRLRQVTNPVHGRLLREYVTWQLLPALHRTADRAPLTPGTRNAAAGRLTGAAAFLDWLAARGRGPGQAARADIDAWHARHAGARTARHFLAWAMATGRMSRLGLPPAARAAPGPVTQQHRLAVLGRFLSSPDIPLRTRVAGCLVMLYAQPVSRLVRLRTGDIITSGEDTLLALGDPPAHVPAPLAAMLAGLAAARANMSTAANPGCDWLFPGGRAGQPLTPGSLTRQLRAHGVPVTQARTAAFRQLVLQAPAPVIARALSYNPGTAAGHVTTAGGTWSRYPATRTP